MIIKYERTVGLGENAVVEETTKALATHKHTCYHDEENPKSCKKEEIK